MKSEKKESNEKLKKLIIKMNDLTISVREIQIELKNVFKLLRER